MKYAITILSILFIIFNTCSISYTQKQAEKIIISAPSGSLNNILIPIGIRRGIYLEEGLKVQIVVMKSELSISGLLADEVDYTVASGSTIRAAVTGVPVKVIAHIVGDSTFTLFGRSEINSIKELKGKIIGTTGKFSSTTFVAMEILRHYGIDPQKDVTFLSTGETARSLAALQSGSISATLLSPPYDTMAKRMGLRQLAYAADFVKLPQNGIGTSVKKIKNNTTQIRRLLRATSRSMNNFIEKREEAIDYIMKYFKLDRESASDSYEKVKNALALNGQVEDKAIVAEINQVKAVAGIKSEIPLSQVIDYSFIKEVMKELKGK